MKRDILCSVVFCVAVYFNDGTTMIFPKATNVSERDWGRTQMIVEEIYAKNGAVLKYNYIAKIATNAIKYIDLKCKEQPR